MKSHHIWSPILLVGAFTISTSRSIVVRAAGSAAVNINISKGPATALGSGFIYGFPDNGTKASTSIPDYFLTDIKFRASRAGGAQISAAGWAYGGKAAYKGRFESTLSNYLTTRKYGADFLLLPHDLWGAQGGANSQTPFPGDKGNWAEAELFLNQLISDMKANKMLDGVVVDLWNEPDLEGFWARPWSQYLEYIGRAHKIFKAQLPNLLISGPSSAHSPNVNSDNWKQWCSYVVANKAIPDIYAWHQIGSWEREPDSTIPDFESLRRQYNLPSRPIDINEYAWPDEQTPAGSVFYISQLERHNLRGLRANWGSGSDLHDYLGALVSKSANKKYYPNGDWQLYKYYSGMTGDRVATVAASDKKFDVFGTRSGQRVKIIAGTRTAPGAYDIQITGLTNLTLPSSGTIKVRTLQFNWSGPKGEVGNPLDLGTKDYTYSNGAFTIRYAPTSTGVAYAYELN